MSEQVNKQLGDENLARRRDWLAIFDNQVKSTPLTVTLFANPIFALPLGIHAEEWTADMTKDGLSEIVRASFGDNPPLSQVSRDAIMFVYCIDSYRTRSRQR